VLLAAESGVCVPEAAFGAEVMDAADSGWAIGFGGVAGFS
jgi:hypothetical protein